MKRTLALILTIIMLGSCICALAEKGAPDIPPVLVSQPRDVTVKEGGKCSFSVGQTGAHGITWRLHDPVTETFILCTNANDVFPGLEVSGKNGETLTLSNVPAELNGWQAFCTLNNSTGATITRYALITVTDRDGNPLSASAPETDAVPEPDASPETDAVPEPDVTPEADIAPEPDNAPEADAVPETPPAVQSRLIHVKAIGCTLQELDGDGNPEGPAESEMTFRNCADFRVTCTAKQAKYWFINGVRYRFEDFPKNFTVIGLKEDMTIECCSAKATPETVPSKEAVQSARTGETLTVAGEGAKLCHVRNNTTGAGGFFDSIDFTDDFINLASGKQEQGGRITVKVSVSRSGASCKHWLFNGAHIMLSVPQSYFFVDELNASMVYGTAEGRAKPDGSCERVTGAAETRTGNDASVIGEQQGENMCSVTCTGCTFTGAGYTNAQQGTVPYGSKVTFTAPAGKKVSVNGIVISGSVTITVYNDISAEER